MTLASTRWSCIFGQVATSVVFAYRLCNEVEASTGCTQPRAGCVYPTETNTELYNQLVPWGMASGFSKHTHQTPALPNIRINNLHCWVDFKTAKTKLAGKKTTSYFEQAETLQQKSHTHFQLASPSLQDNEFDYVLSQCTDAELANPLYTKLISLMVLCRPAPPFFTCISTSAGRLA